MSKMDRLLNSKNDKETIYEIYRACRLCGAGAGYKMPIIQNVVDLEDTDVELKQKIRECVQIEVHQDDKMPPLICELCVDKVNDFYEFLDMCRQTNKKTRLRLGLPPQSMPRGAPDAGECILGLTEPVYVNEDSDAEPLSKQKKMQPKVIVKREPELKVKVEKRILTGARPTRFRRRSPTPPRITRHSKNNKDDTVSLNRLQDKSRSSKPAPKSILKKETKTEDKPLLSPRLKRTRDTEPVKLETPVKKVKIALRSTPHSTSKCPPKMSPKPNKRPPSPPKQRLYPCVVCSQQNKTPQAAASHLRSHTVTYTNTKMACNPCGLWFPSAEEAAAHHKQHRTKSRPYNCRRCTANFKHLSAYDGHFDVNECIPWPEIPDVKCEVCWHLFPTNKLLTDHKCLGEDHRPGGKCSKCNRNYALLKNLKKHEQSCTAKKKGELTIDPALLEKVRPLQVRMSRCDPLLTNVKQEHYDVSDVAADYGLDKNCVYPYISSVFRIKSEPDGMVAFDQDIKDEFFLEQNYVHWDSDSESDADVSSISVLNPYEKKRRVDSLTTLTLKTIFSQRCLGRVPRRRRRDKPEKSIFDSLLGETEDDVTRDINNIIDNLGDDDDIVDRTVEGDDKDKSIDLVDNKSTDVENSDDVADKNDVDKETDGVVDKSTIVDQEKSNGTDNNEDNSGQDTIKPNAVSLDENATRNDQIDTPNDVSVSEINDSGTNDQNDNVSSLKDKDVSANDINDSNSAYNNVTGTKNNKISVNNDDITRTDDKVKINNGTINKISVGNNDSNNVNKGVDNDSLSTEDKVNDFNEDAKATRNDTKLKENLPDDDNGNDAITGTDKEFDDNAKSMPENGDGTSHDVLSIEDTNQDSKAVNSTALNKDIDRRDGKMNDPDRISEAKLTLNSKISKSPTESEDIDDSKLMAALDAQIGDSNDDKNLRNDVNEKVGLHDKPMDVDIITEGFNFDT